jgi:hypothetical protein
VAKPKAAALDLNSLENRLKATQATKLTLKNQIDESLDRFRGFYQGKLKVSLAELRRSYDMLVLKCAGGGAHRLGVHRCDGISSLASERLRRSASSH